MNWSGVKVSEVQNGKKSMLKIIDMTIFFWGICGLIEDYEVSLPKVKSQRENFIQQPFLLFYQPMIQKSLFNNKVGILVIKS